MKSISSPSSHKTKAWDCAIGCPRLSRQVDHGGTEAIGAGGRARDMRHGEIVAGMRGHCCLLSRRVGVRERNEDLTSC